MLLLPCPVTWSLKPGWSYLRMKKWQTLRKQQVHIQRKRNWVGALLVNLEDVYKATWIPSIFIMTAREVEICWSREDISAGEQAQAALIQEEEAVTASACMYCQHQHTDRRKGFASSREFEPLGSLAWLCSYHQYISTRDIICSHTSCSPQRRAERCIRIL